MPNIKSIIKVISFIIVIAACTLACRKELPLVHGINDENIFTYSQLFDRFWNQMNSRYQFWDVDTTDWDGMYSRYKPLFDKLDINNETDQRKSVQYFHEILNGSLDGHLIMLFYPPAIYDSSVYPRLDQNELTINHIKNVNPLLLPREQQRTPDYYEFNYYAIDEANYLDAGSISGIYTDPIEGDVEVLGGTINDNILYLGFNYQELTPALANPENNLLKSAYNAFHQALYNNPNLKGVIIDMRGSLGGHGQDAIILASNMIDKPVLWGTVRHKNGTGRLDYTPWVPTYINPAPNAKAIKVPLIILTDVLTYSGAEYVTSALKAIPGAVSVGTATRGGVTGWGIIESMQGDGFITFRGITGNLMDLVMSPSAFRSPDGTMPIWGLKPDYEVPFDTVAIQQGRDLQLEKALSLIH